MASWEKLEPLLTELLDLEPHSRDQRLDALHLSDPAIVIELRELLVAAEQTRWDQQMSGAAAGAVVQALGEDIERAQDLTGSRIGRYQTQSLLGRGGMGVVYLAERADGAFEQRVAVKILPPRSFDSGAGERFLAERQILARLEHANIARLLDGGLTDDGSPYFVMEYVDGSDIATFCDSRQLDLSARLELFDTLLGAVAFAHSQLVVHGDLKPANVLVAATGEPKLLDFGIAEVLNRSRQDADSLLALTPNYASPEQVRGESLSALSDVYALGVLLYRLLCGRVPMDYSGMDPEAMASVVGRIEYPAVSDTAKLAGVTTELDWIIRRALGGDAQDRYASVADLRADLHRFRGHQPLQAHPPSRTYTLRKFLRRHRVGAVLSSLFLLAIVGGVIATSTQAQRATAQAARAERISTFLQSLFDAANPFGAWKTEKSVRDLLQYADARYEQDLADDPRALADMQHMLGVAYLGNGEYRRATVLLAAALKARQAQDGLRSESAAKAHNDLANAQIENGDYEAAKRQANSALAIYTHTLGRNSVLAADAITNLAVAISSLGDKPAAQVLHEEALTIRSQLLPANHVSIADSKASLAAVQAAQGNRSQVLALNQEAYAIYEAAYGSEHPLSVRAMNGVASGEFLAGNLQSAAGAFEQLLKQAQARLGADHPELALVLNNLGRVRSELGDFSTAQILLDRAATLVDAVDTQKMLRISVTFNQGTVLAELGHYDAARSRLSAAREQFVELLGVEHGLVRRADLGLSNNEYLNGDRRTACEQYARTVEALSTDSAHANWLATAQLGLGRCHNAFRRYDEAMAQLNAARSVLSASLPKVGWRTTEFALQEAVATGDQPAQRQLARKLVGQLSTGSVRRLNVSELTERPPPQARTQNNDVRSLTNSASKGIADA